MDNKNFFERTLPNKKTYLAALGIILIGVGQFINGDATLMEAGVYVLNGLGLAGIKAAINTKE